MEQKHEIRNGFSLTTATIFIVGEVAGVGILFLPHVIAQTSWFGMPAILFTALSSGIAGLYLAKCWIILEERYPKYRNSFTRKPFATIGHHAYGRYMSAFISIIMNITMIGSTTVIILLISKLLESLTNKFIPLNFCQWAPIISVLLLGPLWLGSPIDFWPIAYCAMFSTLFGTIITLILLIIKISNDGFFNEYHQNGFIKFTASLGTLMFSFGGTSAFPNFQNDMKNKRKFPRAVIYGFFALVMLYSPIAGLAYGAFGHKVQPNILDSFDTRSHKVFQVLTPIAQICFLIHCISVVSLVINPVFLDMEELLKIPKYFNWKRCLFRTGIVVLCTFLGETFPNFNQIVDLIGASTIALMAFILPPLFYIKLCHDDQKKIPLYKWIIFIIIVIFGIICGLASTYSTLINWSPLDSACYLKSSSNKTVTKSYNFLNFL